LPRVLVAEDHDTDFLLLNRHIKKHWPGCESARAGSRAELEVALAKSWDLIITDYHLLDIQERELLDLIAAMQPQTRCILWSGSMYELIDIDLPRNIVCKLEKGDYVGLNHALASNWP
jgi:response regulator RpfG family c-di-GMP phosphodiesterase